VAEAGIQGVAIAGIRGAAVGRAVTGGPAAVDSRATACGPITARGLAEARGEAILLATGSTDGGFADSTSVTGTSEPMPGSPVRWPCGRNIEPTASTEPKVTTAVATVALFTHEAPRPLSGTGSRAGTGMRTVVALSRPSSCATVIT
jgi:hypothetical protein